MFRRTDCGAVDVTTFDVPKDDSTTPVWQLSSEGKEQR